jgi:hypothetical protein
VSRISIEDAFLMLAKWREERRPLQFTMSRPVGQHATSAAFVTEVLPHSQKVLLTLRDANGEDVPVTVSLAGAEWECEDAGGVLPEFAETKWVCFRSATFPNGNRYVLGERATPESEGNV